MILIGDVHGEIHKLREKIESLSLNGETFVQVGDFGIGFRSSSSLEFNVLYQLNEYLSSIGSEMYIIRGNHDNPSYWYSKHEKLTNVHLIKDNSIFEIEGKNILFIGGANSVDRLKRTKSKSWWKGERINKMTNIDKYLSKYSTIDIVISHSAPSLFTINSSNRLLDLYALDDTTIKFDVNDEREYLTEIFNACKNKNLKHWYYGHFHEYNNQIIEGVNAICLDILQFYQS